MGALPAFGVTLPFILARLKWWLLQTVRRLLQQSSDPLCFRRQSGLLKHIRLVRSFRKSAREQVDSPSHGGRPLLCSLEHLEPHPVGLALTGFHQLGYFCLRISIPF